MSDQLPSTNLFMLLERVNRRAFGPLPAGYRIRPCRPEELPVWKRMPFDDRETAAANAAFMDAWFDRVYGAKQALFFERCLFAATGEDAPVATCMLWKAYGGRVTTLHWFKVCKDHEGRGIGRALLTQLFSPLQPDDLPVLLHTQPESDRAIKLYSDLGFKVLTNPRIGGRANDIETGMPLLEKTMTPRDFYNLQFTAASQALLDVLDGAQDEF